MSWKEKYASRVLSPEEAAAKIKHGDRVFLGSMCAEPRLIIRGLSGSYVEDVEFVQLKAGEEASRLVAERKPRFRLRTFYIGRGGDGSDESSQADYAPLFHSEIPRFFKNRRIAIDVAVVQVSEPDRFGQVSLGISVDISRSALESARLVIAQVNPRMPRTLGSTFIPVDRIHYLVDGEQELTELENVSLTETDRAISRFCSELIEDGSVLQAGFAAISHGLNEFIMDRKDLGVHTEMFTDPIIDLIEAGVVTNATKPMHTGKSVATFCMGTRRLYDYVDSNPLFEFQPTDAALNPLAIASIPNMVAINIAVQVDLRGQIRQGGPQWTPFEGSGGDQDFMRGAGLSRGGRSIVCLRSTDARGRSTIVPHFGPKAAVIMNRGDVHYVVTEYGVAYLGGKSIRERALALIEIAHPTHRESLMNKAQQLGFVHSDQFYVKAISPGLRARIRTDRVLKDGLKFHMRALKPTDEGMLRDLFYHLSDNSKYFRYFSQKRSMPLQNLRKYVNLAADKGLSIVATIGPRENRRMIGEARYVFVPNDPLPDCAIMVDEEFQKRRVGGHLLRHLIEIAIEQGVPGFKGDVLPWNDPAVKLLEGLPYVIHRKYVDGVLEVRFMFDEFKEPRQE